MKLYEIHEAIQAAVNVELEIDEETGEILNPDFDPTELQNLEMDFDEKVLSIAGHVKNDRATIAERQATIDEYKKEIQRLDKLNKATDRYNEQMCAFTLGMMRQQSKTKIRDAHHTVSIRKTPPKCEVTNVYALTDSRFIVTTTKPNKLEIMKHWRETKHVPKGVDITTSTKLNVR